MNILQNCLYGGFVLTADMVLLRNDDKSSKFGPSPQPVCALETQTTMEQFNLFMFVYICLISSWNMDHMLKWLTIKKKL